MSAHTSPVASALSPEFAPSAFSFSFFNSSSDISGGGNCALALKRHRTPARGLLAHSAFRGRRPIPPRL